jgi:hypothetical protein
LQIFYEYSSRKDLNSTINPAKLLNILIVVLNYFTAMRYVFRNKNSSGILRKLIYASGERYEQISPGATLSGQMDYSGREGNYSV